MSVTHLVLAGIATSGVVLSTLREAADRDYQLTFATPGSLARRFRSASMSRGGRCCRSFPVT
jgi:nicotinamidase-related amidase